MKTMMTVVKITSPYTAFDQGDICLIQQYVQKGTDHFGNPIVYAVLIGGKCRTIFSVEAISSFEFFAFAPDAKCVEALLLYNKKQKNEETE